MATSGALPTRRALLMTRSTALRTMIYETMVLRSVLETDATDTEF